MTSQDQKAKAFRALHHQPGAFVLPNPWDQGTARILERHGFQALATSSAAMAFALGIVEGVASQQQTLDHCRLIVDATPLPVTADMEKGFGDSPESVAETIRLAASCGLAGCSIEDHTGSRDQPIYDFPLALERVQAGVEASLGLGHDFVFTARCENLLWGLEDLDDVIARLQAFESAGADVLYAPGLYNLSTIQEVCSAVSRPVNVVMGMPGATFSVSNLANAGVKRISTGSALARSAFGTFVNAAKEMENENTFTFSDQAIGFKELELYFDTK